MPEIQRLLIQDENETYEVYVEAETGTSLPEPGTDDDRPGAKGAKDIVDLKKAREVIRGQALFVIGAFKNFAAAEIEEVNIKFGLKFSGTGGIPFIAQGSGEKTLEIEVKCKFPKPQSSQGTH